MSILIAYEASGALRRRFAKAGYDAISVDLQPARDFVAGQFMGRGRHLINDAAEVIMNPRKYTGAKNWDLIIAHPPCTAVALSGNAHYSAGKPKWNQRLESINYINNIWREMRRYGRRAILENPRGVLSMTPMGRPTQSIQPYQFGDDASKETCLWIHNMQSIPIPARHEWVLPRLVCKCGYVWMPGQFPGRCDCGRYINEIRPRWANQCDSGQNKLPPSPDRADIRAETYPGIADAIVAHCIIEMEKSS